MVQFGTVVIAASREARLGLDARNCVVLDSACSSTVCGKFWLDGYLKSLDKEDKTKVYHSDGVNVFLNLEVEPS